ncbi:MAG: hypothetical protein M1813_007372 [Trichoglossum hirsutum]|nr:MAG: hypothetical protein M1813_007372 [Trichoglossum hirsutum]
MARTLRLSFSLLIASLCSLVFASPDNHLRFRALSFANSSSSSTEFSSSTSSSTSSTTSSSVSRTTSFTGTTSTLSNTSIPVFEPKSTTIIDGNSTAVGIPGPTITEPPNFDLSGLGAFDPALSSYIVAHNLYSINWADLIGLNNGSLVYKQPSSESNTTSCPSFWVFPTPEIIDPEEVTVVQIVTISADSFEFCGTTTYTPPPPPPPPSRPQGILPPSHNNTGNVTAFPTTTNVAASSLASSPNPNPTKKTKTIMSSVWQEPAVAFEPEPTATDAIPKQTAPPTLEPPPPTFEAPQPVPGSNGNNPSSNGNNPGSNGNNPGSNGNNPGSNGNNPGSNGNNPGSNGNNPGSNGNNPGSSAVESNLNDGIASAIAHLFPGSSPSNGGPGQPQNPSPPGDSSAAGIISNVLGAYIASVFSGGSPGTPNAPGTPGNPGNPGSNIPSEGQVNGIPYSVGSAAIVVDGKTYSPATPTVVTLPNGQSANIGPNGLSIGNSFVPINPGNTGGSPGSPSQGNINGVPYSLTPNGIVISGTTYSTSQPTSVTLPNGQTLAVGPGGTVQIGGTTVPTLSQSGNTNGVPYTITPSGIVISGTTYSLSQPTSVTLPNGQTLVVGPGGTVQIGGTTVPTLSQSGNTNGVPYTITPSGIVISGTTYSLSQPTSVTLPNGQTLVIGANGMVQIGGTTIQVPTSGSFNGISYTITPSGSIVINGQTLSPSSPTSITLPGGHVISIGPNGLIIDGTTVPVTLGLGPSTNMPHGMGVTTATATSTGSVTTSRPTGSSSSETTSSSSKTTTTSSTTSSTSAASASKTAAPKKAAAVRDRDLTPLGTVLIVGLSSVLIAWL